MLQLAGTKLDLPDFLFLLVDYCFVLTPLLLQSLKSLDCNSQFLLDIPILLLTTM